MRDLIDDTACCGAIRPLNGLIQLRDAKALNDSLLILRKADHTAVILDLDRTS